MPSPLKGRHPRRRRGFCQWEVARRSHRASIAGAVVLAVAQTWIMLLVGRGVLGVAIGESA